jgi:hypothetical protein
VNGRPTSAVTATSRLSPCLSDQRSRTRARSVPPGHVGERLAIRAVASCGLSAFAAGPTSGLSTGDYSDVNRRLCSPRVSRTLGGHELRGREDVEPVRAVDGVLRGGLFRNESDGLGIDRVESKQLVGATMRGDAPASAGDRPVSGRPRHISFALSESPGRRILARRKRRRSMPGRSGACRARSSATCN